MTRDPSASGARFGAAATVTGVKPRPSPFLNEILNGFRARGWNPADLDRYRMEGDTPPPPAPPAPPAPDLAGLQRAIDDAKTSGSTEATGNLLKALGFDKLEDAQAWVTTKRDAERAGMDEASRLKAEAEDAKRAAETEKATAEQEKADAARAKFDANLLTFLVQCEVPAAALSDAATLVTAELQGKIDAKADDVVAATAKVRDRQPALFAAAADDGTGGGAPSGVPGGKPPTPKPTDAYDRGRKRGEEERKAAAERAPLFAGMSTIGSPNGT